MPDVMYLYLKETIIYNIHWRQNAWLTVEKKCSLNMYYMWQAYLFDSFVEKCCLFFCLLYFVSDTENIWKNNTMCFNGEHSEWIMGIQCSNVLAWYITHLGTDVPLIKLKKKIKVHFLFWTKNGNAVIRNPLYVFWIKKNVTKEIFRGRSGGFPKFIEK